MATTPLNVDQTYQSLRKRLMEIEDHLVSFEKMLGTSQEEYELCQALLSDPELKSSLLEAHTLHLNRQWAAIERMKALHQKVLDQLATFEQDQKISRSVGGNQLAPFQTDGKNRS